RSNGRVVIDDQNGFLTSLASRHRWGRIYHRSQCHLSRYSAVVVTAPPGDESARRILLGGLPTHIRAIRCNGHGQNNPLNTRASGSLLGILWPVAAQGAPAEGPAARRADADADRRTLVDRHGPVLRVFRAKQTDRSLVLRGSGPQQRGPAP